MHFAIPILFMMMLQSGSFKQTQLSNARVRLAYDEKEQLVKDYFRKQNLTYEGFRLFIRAFKTEGKVEVWVRENRGETFHLIQTYDFCSTSGTPGPKRKEGDLQVPEGIYHLNHFNPQSRFHLSLGVSYPNASDRILSDQTHPGGAIYIHGNCVTVGCIPITDAKISELYVMAVEARNNGQQKIPIHIFPARLDDNGMKALLEISGDQNKNFWLNLKEIYTNFEETKKLKRISVNEKGAYVLESTSLVL